MDGVTALTNHRDLGELFYKTIKAHCPRYHHALDVGCGYGVASEHMRLMCSKMTLIDTSQSAIDHQLHHWSQDEDVFISCGSIHSINGRFDLIYYFLSLHHIADTNAELAKARELLAKDGELVICEISATHEVPYHRNETVPYDVFIPNQLSHMLSEAGFAVVRKDAIARINKDNVEYDVFYVICR